MNNLIIFLTLAALCIGYTHGSIYCYFCANCPIPFRSDVPGVTVVTAGTNFCAKKARSSAPSTPNSLGAAEPGLCVVAGCRWIYDSTGAQIYVCCCQGNYCNGSM